MNHTQVNLNFQKLAGVALGLLVGGTCWVVSPKAALAQSTDPLDNHNERTSDPFSEHDSGGYQPFFDMMHRVQLGNIRSVSEYNKDQQENVGSEAESFRTRQMQLINQQNGQNPAGTASPNAAPVQQTLPPQATPAQ